MEETDVPLQPFQSVLKSTAHNLMQSYGSHVRRFKDEISKLKEENTALAKENEKLKTELSYVKEKCRTDHSDFIRLRKELSSASARLAAPCDSCRALLQQVREQQLLLRTIVEQKDPTAVHLLEKYVAEKSSVRDVSEPGTERDTEPNKQPAKVNEDHSVVAVGETASPPPALLSEGSKKKDDTSPNSIHCAKLKLSKQTKRSRYRVLEEIAPDSKRLKVNSNASGSECSPSGTDSTKGNTGNYSKKPLESDSSTVEEGIVSKVLKFKKPPDPGSKSPPRFYVPESCAFSPNSSDYSGGTRIVKRKGPRTGVTARGESQERSINKCREKSPQIMTSRDEQVEGGRKRRSMRALERSQVVVVPETVPMECYSEDESNNHAQSEQLHHVGGDSPIGCHNHENMTADNASLDIVASSDDEITKESEVGKHQKNKCSVHSDERAYKIISYRHNPTGRKYVSGMATPISVTSSSPGVSNNNCVTDQNDTVRGLLLNPPSHTSTPVCSENMESSREASPVESPVFGENHRRESPVNMIQNESESRRLNKSYSDDESSLLLSNQVKGNEGKQMKVLFGSGESKENRSNSNRANPASYDEDPTSNTSPSVLSGKIKQTSGSGKAERSSQKSRTFVPLEMVTDGESPYGSKLGKEQIVSKYRRKSPRNSGEGGNGSPGKHPPSNRQLGKNMKSPAKKSPMKLSRKFSSDQLAKGCSSPQRIGRLVITKNAEGKCDKRLLQTKISANAFVRKRPSSKQLAQIFNGQQAEVACAKQEQAWIEQAKQASLREMRPAGSRQSRDIHTDLDTADVDSINYPMTGPRFTSTPAIPRNKKAKRNQYQSGKIKKKITPEKGGASSLWQPQTPTRQPISSQSSQSARHSPRFKNVEDDCEKCGLEDQCDGNDIAMGGQGEDGNTTGHFEPSEVMARGYNDTLDPHVRLSEYDHTYAPMTEGLPKAEVEEGQEMISFSDMDRAARAQSTQEYLNSLDNNNDRVTRSKAKGASQESGTSNQSSGAASQKGLRAKRAPRAKTLVAEEERKATEKSEPNVQVVEEPIPSKCETKEDVDGPQNDIQKPKDIGIDDSFDRVPGKVDPAYKYTEVVRKQADRRRLEAYVCKECDLYFSGLGLTDEEKADRMKSCRHRARYAPPDTPEHFWSIEFPDTQQCKDRGYLNVTQAKPSKARRRRPLRKLFRTTDKVDTEGQESKVSDISD